MTLHFSQIFLTLGRTFMSVSLEAICNAASGEVVWSEFNLDFVTGKNTDVVHAHLSGDVRQHVVTILKLYAKHCVWERLKNRALEHDRIFFRLSQDGLL
jgi:ATP-dependent RNA circularization protein (DNA/RNA ligase family)